MYNKGYLLICLVDVGCEILGGVIKWNVEM